MIEALAWWLTIELIGVIAFPIAFVALRFLPDRGYSFSKIIGLLLMTYLLWMGASAHIIPNRRWSIALILALIGLTSAVLAYRHRSEIRDFLRQRWHHILFGEVLVTIAFMLALFLKSYVADITFPHSDNIGFAAFINVTLRSEYFPPEDPWLSGNPISYYYFGHLGVATLTKLTGISSFITFNLAVATAVALAAAGAFGIVYNLVIGTARAVPALAAGFLGAIFLTVLSNLEGLFELLAANGVGSQGFYRFLDIFGLDGLRLSSEWYPTEPFWTRRAILFADDRWDSIFPFYNYLNGELDAQTLAIPFLLLVVAFALNLWRSIDSSFLNLSPTNWLPIGLTALALGALIAAHSWDFPTAVLLTLLILSLRSYLYERRISMVALRRTGAFAAVLVTLSVLLFLPFYLSSAGQFGGIETLSADSSSKPHHFIYMWLPLLWLAASLAVISIGSVKNTAPGIRMAGGAILLLLALWAAFVFMDQGVSQLRQEVTARGWSWATVGILAGALGISIVALSKQLALVRNQALVHNTVFPLALSVVAILLILGVELFWISDASGFVALNTIVRVNFQAWLLLSIAGAFGAYHVASAWRTPRILPLLSKATWGTVTVVILSAGLIFPVTATFYFTDAFGGERNLDGLNLIKRFQPDEYAALQYLSDNVEGTPIILEAVGGSFTYSARISAFSGLPTVLGWDYHVASWHGSWDLLAGRAQDVELLYKTTDPAQSQEILTKYGAEYVYVGRLERGQYGEAGLAKFRLFMDTVFERGEVSIYQVRPQNTDRTDASPANESRLR